MPFLEGRSDRSETYLTEKFKRPLLHRMPSNKRSKTVAVSQSNSVFSVVQVTVGTVFPKDMLNKGTATFLLEFSYFEPPRHCLVLSIPKPGQSILFACLWLVKCWVFFITLKCPSHAAKWLGYHTKAAVITCSSLSSVIHCNRDFSESFM